MIGADYVERMRKFVLSADERCRYDEKQYQILSGNVGLVADLSALFVFCRPGDCEAWQAYLIENVVAGTHLSLQVVPYATDPHFIVRGTMGPDFVFRKLWDLPRPPLKIIALDLKPERMRWFETEQHGSGAPNIQKAESREDARKLLKKPRGKVKGEGRLIFETTGAPIYYLLFQSSETTPRAIAAKILADGGLPLRDLFLISPQSRHRLGDGSKIKTFGVEAKALDEASAHVHLLERTEVIAVVEMASEVECVPGSKEHHPYQQLIEWAHRFENNPANGVRDIRVEVIPCESVRDAAEFVDPYKTYIDLLESRAPRITKSDRIPVGWLEDAAIPGLNGDPAFEIPQRPTAILGISGRGKSVIAYHLLAQYAKREFNTVFVNFKNADDGVLPDAGPREHSELLDFAAVMHRAADREVIATRWNDLAGQIGSDGRGGHAYYTELWPGPDGALSSDVLMQIIRALKENAVLCFDEVVNTTARMPKLVPAVTAAMKELADVLRTKSVYAMVIHQSLAALTEGGWPGFHDECCFLMTSLGERDRKEYLSFYEKKRPFLEYDVSFERLAGFEGGRFAFVPPTILRDHAPIPLEIPKYPLLEKEEKNALAGLLPWSTIDYARWEKEAEKRASEKKVAAARTAPPTWPGLEDN